MVCRICGHDIQRCKCTGEIDPIILPWLVSVPASDQNFKNNLHFANIGTCKAAIQDKNISQRARAKIEERIKRLEKSA